MLSPRHGWRQTPLEGMRPEEVCKSAPVSPCSAAQGCPIIELVSLCSLDVSLYGGDMIRLLSQSGYLRVTETACYCVFLSLTVDYPCRGTSDGHLACC